MSAGNDIQSPQGCTRPSPKSQGKGDFLPAGQNCQAGLLIGFIIYFTVSNQEARGWEMWLRQAGLQSLPPAHIKAACCRSLCRKRSASSEQQQTPGSLYSGSFPVGLVVKPPSLIVSISSLQSRKLLFLFYQGRVKELQLGKKVFNGAAATNQASYEHVKGKNPAGKKVALGRDALG